MFGSRIGQILRWEQFRIKLDIFVQIFSSDLLTVDLITFIKLPARFCLKAGHFHNSLGRQGPSIHQEQDAFGITGSHQAVDQIHDRKGFSRACGHGYQHVSPAIYNGLFHTFYGFDLKGPQGLIIHFIFCKPIGCCLTPVQHLHERLRGVKRGNLSGEIQRVPQVLKPDDFPIGGIDKWKMVLAKGAQGTSTVLKAPGIPFCLLKDILRPYSHSLALNASQCLSLLKQYVVGRTCFCRVFFNRTVIVLSTCLKGDNGTPPGFPKGFVYEVPPGFGLIAVIFVHGYCLMSRIYNIFSSTILRILSFERMI